MQIFNQETELEDSTHETQLSQKKKIPTTHLLGKGKEKEIKQTVS